VAHEGRIAALELKIERQQDFLNELQRTRETQWRKYDALKEEWQKAKYVMIGVGAVLACIDVPRKIMSLFGL
jgi:hypothetical protein